MVLNHVTGVVAGLVPATSNVEAQSKNNRDGRDKPGHDREENLWSGGYSMVKIANRTTLTVVEEEIAVVLIQPELLGGNPDLAGLRQTLESSSQNIRVLLCLSDRTSDTIVDALAEIGAEVEILLGPGIEPPQTRNFVLQAPPGTSKDDQNEFALALSDVVLIARGPEMAPGPEMSRLARVAAELRKPLAALGARLPAVPRIGRMTDRLDPEVPGWRSRWWPRVFGRLEQSIIELCAMNWIGGEGGFAESRKRMRQCWSSTWRPASYFPDGWRELCPDRCAVDSASKIVSCFDAMDRSALYGSYIHRDFTWIEYLGAAFAVLMAVIGVLWKNQPITGSFEFLLLLLVLTLVFFARSVRLQDRWTACRLGAEQLRIARMSLPLLVVPPALATADTPAAGDGKSKSSNKAELDLAVLTEAKRAVRAQGLPRVAFALDNAVKWLRLIVDDQIAYHHRNHRKLETAERRLRLVTAGIFVSAIIAVVTHFHWPAEGLILFTAAAPAFAAALHGAVARVGIVHRAALSAEAEKELTRISGDLAKPVELPVSEDAWRRVRRLAFEAAAAMGRENTSWHGLVRRYTDELP